VQNSVMLEALELLVQDNIHRAKLIGTQVNWAAIHQAQAAIQKAGIASAESVMIDEREITKQRELANLFTGCANLLDIIKQEWGPSWSEWDQSIRDGITTQLKAIYALMGEKS